jgi:hypothetical protein
MNEVDIRLRVFAVTGHLLSRTSMIRRSKEKKLSR